MSEQEEGGTVVPYLLAQVEGGRVVPYLLESEEDYICQTIALHISVHCWLLEVSHWLVVGTVQLAMVWVEAGCQRVVAEVVVDQIHHYFGLTVLRHLFD